MGSLSLNTDPSFPSYGEYAMEYRVTKAAVNMLLVLYSSKLKDIKILGVDPGFCATNVIGDPDALRKMGAMEPEVGGPVHCVGC
jgi:NAD(P)-dependent dehydrogenase (short-subunit alcohol dehydrogenase family)